MKSNDLASLKGKISIKIYDKNQKLKSEYEGHNIITDAGKNALATWLAAGTQSTAFMQYIGLGTGTASELDSDTALETPTGNRIAGTLSFSTNIRSNQATFVPGNATGAIAEAGMFSDLTGGTMFARVTFPVQNKLAGDTVVFTWSTTFI